MVSIGLAEQLVEKGMIDKERLEIFKNSAGTIQQRVPHTIIYALGQPFRYVVRHTRTDWADIAFAGESGKLVHLRASHSVKLRELLDLEVPGADKDKDDLVLSVYLDHDPENKRQPLVLRLAEDARAPYSEFLRKDMILPCLTLSKKSSHRFGDHYITSRLDDVLKILLPTKA
ncbi:hypothetical protein VNI00_006970 [Paramarasmius palmivorus]|uniref:Uncharacterized protein n=1 Tax=Paramarasmius palmivorus TaxID=297713 RepID=A0AAW0D5C8_9AGAR